MKQQYLGISIDLSKDENLTNFSKSLLKDYYMKDDEISPQHAYARAATAYCGGDIELAQRIYDYASQGWFMYSSPILSNASRPNEKEKGLPISCFLTYVDDTLEGLISHTEELRWMSIKGGGVGGHWSSVRSNSKLSPGPIPFLKTVDSDMTAYRQGKTRKGSYASYMDISHPDIIEYLNMRLPTGGDANRKCFNLNNAINITDDFMECVLKDKEWNLIDPNEKTIRETIKARDLWERILKTRFRTGEPYINFIDEANRNLPKYMSDKGLKIHGSNLCNEIHLPTNNERSAVCCLSSLNLEKYDEWQDSNIVEDLITYLDNVIEYFILNAPKQLSKAIFSASQERSLGLGTMGFHSYLQLKNIPFESVIAKAVNNKIFSSIKEKALKQTKLLAEIRGEAPDAIGFGVRNTHLLAIAPNANSSIIVGCSPSIEPFKSNAYTHRTRAGSYLVKNIYLDKLLHEYATSLQVENVEEWIDEKWKSIILNQGSIQHFDFITDWHKLVFKTAFELDQRWIVDHAADRQTYICQGQSLNLFFPAGTQKSIVNNVHLRAWTKKVKGLYYLRTTSGSSAEKISEKIKEDKIRDFSENKNDECLSCQG